MRRYPNEKRPGLPDRTAGRKGDHMDNRTHKETDTRLIAMIGLMAALVFVGSKIEIRFPTILGVSRFHLGNGLCLLSGYLLGAVSGGLAAGFGSFLFDVVFWGGSPAGWIVTFATKFLMGFVGGLCFRKHMFRKFGLVPELILCGILGEAAYIAGYLAKEFVTYRFIMGSPMSAVSLMMVEKLASSAVNAVIAIVVSIVLYTVLKPVLAKSGLLYDRK